jgi:hypothetical protein
MYVGLPVSLKTYVYYIYVERYEKIISLLPKSY